MLSSEKTSVESAEQFVYVPPPKPTSPPIPAMQRSCSSAGSRWHVSVRSMRASKTETFSSTVSGEAKPASVPANTFSGVSTAMFTPRSERSRTEAPLSTEKKPVSAVS